MIKKYVAQKIKNQITAVHRCFVIALVMIFPVCLQAQQTYTFTSAGITGSVGPTQTDINTAYGSTNLSGSVVVTAGIQSFTVPTTGMYRVTAIGASGAGADGGKGAIMTGDFSFTANDVVKIVVGQMGVVQSGEPNACGGSGGSFVVRAPATSTNDILVIAGGGGGSPANYSNGRHASLTTSGNNGAGVNNTDGAGGTNGNGGNKSVSANDQDRGAGGGGFLTNGQSIAQPSFIGAANGGLSFLNGATGGSHNTTGAPGGFGGGGAVWTTGYRAAGGGGGFSGGGGGQTNTNANTQSGGGGGSFNSGINQTSVVATFTGDGKVIFEELCPVKIFATGSNSLNPVICAGTTLTLTTNAVSNYSWSNGATTSSIVISPNTNTVYGISATSSLNCTASSFMNIVVSSGLPVLSIANPSNNICLGRTVSLTASGALTYTWSNPGVVNGQTFTPTSTAAYTVTGQNGCGTTVSTTTITVAPLAVSVLASPTLVCQGYTSTLTAVAAVNGYSWQPNNATGSTTFVAPLANTIYTVTASDGTCSGTATLAVNTMPTPTITAAASSSNICEGEQTTLTANGASTYTWSPGNLNGNSVNVSPATSTLYVVNGTNSFGCISSITQIVLVKPAPPVTVAANKTLTCINSSIVLTAGGAGSYTWTNGPQAGTYTVFPTGPTVYTVTGFGPNGCPKTRTISVDVVVPNVVVPANVAVCSGNSATITATGANTYSWNGFNLQSSSYVILPLTNTVVILTANTTSLAVNCITDHTINVSVNPNPTVNIVATKTTVCRNQPTTLSASGALNFNWGTLGTTASVVVSPSVQTTYTVSGTDANGCETVASFIVKVSTCAGIGENTNAHSLMVYPNPNKGSFNVSTTSAIKLNLVNELGQLIMLLDLNEENNFKISVEGLSNGVYFIKGQNDTELINQKIVITN